MRPCSQEGSTRALGIFHFPSKLWVQKALTGGVTKRVTRPERAGQDGVGDGDLGLLGLGGGNKFESRGRRNKFESRGRPASGSVKAVFKLFQTETPGWRLGHCRTLPPATGAQTHRDQRGADLQDIGTLALLGERSVKMPSKLFLLARNKGIIQQ